MPHSYSAEHAENGLKHISSLLMVCPVCSHSTVDFSQHLFPDMYTMDVHVVTCSILGCSGGGIIAEYSLAMLLFSEQEH